MRLRWTERLLLVAFILGWLAPIAWVGLTREPVPFTGRWLNNNYRVSCLFPEAVAGWTSYYLQARLEDSLEWRPLRETDYTQMEPFGHRTRLDRMLGQSVDEPHGMLQRQRIAEFVKTRYERLHPSGPRVDAVRFVYVRFPVGDSLLLAPGPWRKPSLDSLPDRYRPRVFSTHRFDGSLPRDRGGRPAVLGTRP